MLGKIYFLRRTHICNVLTNELKKCLKVFFLKALIEDENKIVKHDPGKCIGCGKCVEVCPFDAIWLNKEKMKAFKCDLCNGDPECVKWCPHGALKFDK